MNSSHWISLKRRFCREALICLNAIHAQKSSCDQSVVLGHCLCAGMPLNWIHMKSTLKTSSATTVATSDDDMQTSEEDTCPKIKIKQCARNLITQAWHFSHVITRFTVRGTREWPQFVISEVIKSEPMITGQTPLPKTPSAQTHLYLLSALCSHARNT